MLQRLVDLVLPRRCAGCGSVGELLCSRCVPGAPLTVPLPAGMATVAAGVYERGLRAALLAYKEGGRRDAAGPLARLLAGAIAGVATAGAVLVPVPSTRAAARRRGGDHVLRLARVAGRSAGLPVVPALRIARPLRDSAGLGAHARAENVAGAMAARAAPGGAVAILIDDIVTSGATLAEALRALRAAGWPVQGAAVVAATPRRGALQPSPGVATGLAVPYESARFSGGTSAHARLALC